MIVMALGDTHGNRGFTKDAISVAASLGVDRIIQVGDFGYWPGTEAGQKFLGEVGRYAVEKRIPFYWLRGNHEDHDMADAEFGTDIPDDDSPFQHGKRLSYIRNGARWCWDGVWFGALGGAFSIDRKFRTKRSSFYGWFPQEVPDRQYIPHLGKLDVLFTHEAPTVPAPLLASGQFMLIEESADSQAVIQEALTASQPDYLVHGHWHVNYRSQNGATEVWGLDCDLSVHNAICIFDTSTRRMYSPTQWAYIRVEEGHGEEIETPQYRATR